MRNIIIIGAIIYLLTRTKKQLPGDAPIKEPGANEPPPVKLPMDLPNDLPGDATPPIKVPADAPPPIRNPIEILISPPIKMPIEPPPPPPIYDNPIVNDVPEPEPPGEIPTGEEPTIKYGYPVVPPPPPPPVDSPPRYEEPSEPVYTDYYGDIRTGKGIAL